MGNSHELEMSPVHYPRGLRIIECTECQYAFAVEVNEMGIIELETKVQINEGDLNAAHSFFQAAVELPQIEISVNAGPAAD